MEMLVHLDSVTVLDLYNKMEVYFNDDHILQIDPDDLPIDWGDSSMAPTTQLIGDDWLDNNESLILQVPSVVVRGEFNYLLNPLHPDFKDIETSDITVYKFDTRLVK